MDNLTKSNKDLNCLLKENIINKSKNYGNNYNDTKQSLYLEDMDFDKDLYFLNIEKIIFSVIKNENNNKSLNNIEIHYRNILTNKTFICKNINKKIEEIDIKEDNDKENSEEIKEIKENLNSIQDDKDLSENKENLEEKFIFKMAENDYIISFKIIYGRYYIIRSIKMKTKKGINFSLPEFTERKSIKPDIYLAVDEINPNINNNVIVNLFYGSGNIIHNIGCEYINEKFYRKILRVKNFINMKGYKKLYKNYNFEEVCQIVNKNIQENIDLNFEYDKGNLH